MFLSDIFSWAGCNQTAVFEPDFAANAREGSLAVDLGWLKRPGSWLLGLFYSDSFVPSVLNALEPLVSFSDTGHFPVPPLLPVQLHIFMGFLIASLFLSTAVFLSTLRRKNAEINGLKNGYQVLDRFLQNLNTGPLEPHLAQQIFTPEQQEQIHAVVATIRAISFQSPGYLYKHGYPAAIVPPTAVLAQGAGPSSSSKNAHRKESCFRERSLSGFVESSSGLASGNVLRTSGGSETPVQTAENASAKSGSPEVCLTEDKRPKVHLQEEKPTVKPTPRISKSASPRGSGPAPLLATHSAKGVSASALLNSRPSFDISSEEGRRALRAYVEKKNKPEALRPSRTEDLPELSPRLTYAEVCKHDPVTKKKYRRVFVANRGWMLMGRLEEEEKKFGSCALVKARTPED